MSVRDTQRNKVHKAVQILDRDSKKIEDIKEVKRYLKRIFTSAWFKKHFPHKTKYEVGDGRARRSVCGYHNGRDGVGMSLPRWSRCESIILRMLAHGLTPQEYAWSGPQFCAVYLRLVERFMGEEAHRKLTFSFRDHDVSFIWFKPAVNELNAKLGLPPSKQELF